MTLDGSASDGGPWDTNVTYQWTKTSGATVTLSGADTDSASFTAPSSAGDLVFTLTVTGKGGGTYTDTDTATVTVRPFDPTLGICGRTEAVRGAIVGQISGITDCADVTDAQLAAITGSLDLNRKGISALAAGDFDGLTRLTSLDLQNTL